MSDVSNEYLALDLALRFGKYESTIAVLTAASEYLDFLNGKPNRSVTTTEVTPPKVGRPKKAAVGAIPQTNSVVLDAVGPIPVPAEDKPAVAIAATPVPAVAEKPPSVEDVRAVLIAVQTKFDKKRAMELLNKWTSGAGVLSKLKEEDRAGVIAEGQALVS